MTEKIIQIIVNKHDYLDKTKDNTVMEISCLGLETVKICTFLL